MSVEIIEHNPSFKKPAMALLEVCKRVDIATRADAEVEAAKQWDAEWRQNPASIMEVLVGAKAIHEEITVDGDPYDGTLEDIQLDLSVDEDADVVSHIEMTTLGEQILSDYAPQNTLATLLEDKPEYAEVFQTVLATCDAKDGCLLPTLEDALTALPQLQPDPKTHQTKIYPQYFIDALETAGAIVWDGSWKLTETGREALAA